MDIENLPLVYVIGDSVSLQYGPYLKRALGGIFAYDRKGGIEKAMLDLDNPEGANGGDSVRVLKFLRDCIGSSWRKPEVLLVNCGLHDIKRNVESGEISVRFEQYRENLKSMIDLCRQAGIRMVWMQTTPVVDAIHNRDGIAFYRYDEDVQRVNEIASAIMHDESVRMIDLYGFSMSLGKLEEQYMDHVHFVDAVREKQGIYIAGFLAGMLGEVAP